MSCFCLESLGKPQVTPYRRSLQCVVSFPRKRESRFFPPKFWMPAPRFRGGSLCAGMTALAWRSVVLLADSLVRTKVATALVAGLLACMAVGLALRVAHAAEAKPAWQLEWEKTLAAAKKEGQVAVYISGYEEVLPDFQKEHPEIKVIAVTGRGSQIGQRLIAERRGEKFLADVVSSGGVTTYQQLHVAKVFDPIKPALLLPEIIDTSKWYQNRHHYADPEGQYIVSYVGSATYGSVSYNTKLVDAKEFKSYWDLLNPKWKGKIISRDIRVPGPGSGNARLFYYLQDVGPSFIRKLYGDMDVTLFRDYRQGSDWLAVGKAALCFFCEVDVSNSRACLWILSARACSRKAAAWCSNSARWRW